MNRGTKGVNSLPETVTRQRRGCDLNRGPTALDSSILTTRLPSDPRYPDYISPGPLRCADVFCSLIARVLPQSRRKQYDAAGASACARRRNDVTRCNGIGTPTYGPLRANTTSSVKPEVHKTVSQRSQRRTEPRPLTYT